ncbi:hypothetical protein F5H01DRAFT_66156 [Linnemannia elongata]|nr:hypothetical protein F5H01DRAFT_66156 [Linnemannia elongata]
MLQSLPGNIMVYKARDSGPMRDKMEQNTLAPTTLQLKVNAQVMMLKNQSGGGMGGLVNGSLGVVVGFVNRPAENDNMVGSDGRSKGSFNAPGEELPLVKFTMDNGTTREMVVGREEWKIELPNGDIQGSRIQIPLNLAWSLSIHKSQGQTLPKVKVDLGKVFEKGKLLLKQHCGVCRVRTKRSASGVDADYIIFLLFDGMNRSGVCGNVACDVVGGTPSAEL